MRYFFVSLLITLGNFSGRSDNYSVFQEGDKYGLKDTQGEIVIPAEYDMLGWSEGEFRLIDKVIGYRKDDQWGLVTISNQVITPAEYFTLVPGGSQWIIASKRSPLTLRISYGLMDTSGKTIIPYKYNVLKLHSMQAIVWVLDGNQMKYGLLDLSNKLILPAVYQNIYPLGSLRYAVQNFDNKTALINESGKLVTPFIIDSIAAMVNDYAVIYQDGNQGLIDREGKIIHQANYREIIRKDGKFMARMPNEWNIINGQYTVIRKLQADSIIAIAPDRYKMTTASGTRLMDNNLAPIGSQSCQWIGSFHGDLTEVKINNRYGILKKDGTLLMPALYDHIQLYENNIIACSQTGSNRSCFLFDSYGRQLTDRSYDAITPANDELFIVSKNGFQGGMNKQGKEFIACAYDSLLEAKQQLIVVKFKGRYGIINQQEHWLVTPQPYRLKLINQDRYFEYNGSLTYLKSINGNTLYFTTNPLLVEGELLRESVANGGQWTLNLNGQIIHREYPAAQAADKIFASSEGYRKIIRNGRAGFIDELSRLRIANRYEDAMNFQEGMAAVMILGKWGFISKEDKVVINPMFESVTPFNKSLSVVKQAGKYGIIDNEGRVVLEYRFDQLKLQDNDRMLIALGNNWGLADKQGNVLIQPRYESLTDLNNGNVLVKQQGKYGLLTLQGINVIPSIYDNLITVTDTDQYLGMISKPLQELSLN